MGIHLPRVKFSTPLSTIFTIFIPRFWFIYSFSYSTNWRKIQFGKEYGSHAWVLTTNSKFDQFTILPKSNSIYSFSRTSNWRRIWARKAFKSLLWKGATISKYVDSLSQPNFQESYSSFSVSPIQNEQPSILDLSMEPLVSPSSNRKIWWTHNFTIIFKINFHTHLFKKN